MLDHAVNRHRNGDPDAPSSNIARCCKNRTDQEGKAMNGEHPVWRLTANVPLAAHIVSEFHHGIQDATERRSMHAGFPNHKWMEL